MRSICNLFAAILVISLNQSAYSSTPYMVVASAEQGLVGTTADITFVTVERFSSMCGRTTTNFAVALPVRADEDEDAVGIPQPKVGKISFDTELKPGTICLMALGPHRGGIKLTLGETLPAIPDGYYQLVIDGADYGYLFVHEEQVELVSDIPQ